MKVNLGLSCVILIGGCFFSQAVMPAQKNVKTEPRRQQILSLLEETGTINVNELAERFRVSLVTIRNDLDDLEKEGLLQRTFGGAVFSHRSQFNESFRERIQQQRHEKRAVAIAALGYI
jgi:DeoR/GlpR family transcriptional regulator of sugar metabolism